MHYHIIWTTYGTWLPGDNRGWLRSGIASVQLPDPDYETSCRNRMKQAVVHLDRHQRDVVVATIHEHCKTKQWVLIAIAVCVNHIHSIIEAQCDGRIIRDQLKAWCSRRLSDLEGSTQLQARKAGRRRWFAEGAYIRRIDSDEYLQVAVEYVTSQQMD